MELIALSIVINIYILQSQWTEQATVIKMVSIIIANGKKEYNTKDFNNQHAGLLKSLTDRQWLFKSENQQVIILTHDTLDTNDKLESTGHHFKSHNKYLS